MVKDVRFVWIKHIYEYSKLTEISTVQKFLTVQDNVYNRKNIYHLMLKSNVQKTHFAFPMCMRGRISILVQEFNRQHNVQSGKCAPRNFLSH